MLTEVKNRVHGLVDELFPGFLKEQNTGIVGFTESSLYLLEDRFSPKQIRRRRRKKLVEVLKRFGTSKAEQTAAKLQQYAAKVLQATVEHVDQHHIGWLKNELDKYCAMVTPVEGRVLACLFSYQDKLSNRCEYALYDAAAQLERALAAFTYVVNECDEDLENLCSNVVPGEGRLMDCIDKNFAKVPKIYLRERYQLPATGPIRKAGP